MSSMMDMEEEFMTESDETSVKTNSESDEDSASSKGKGQKRGHSQACPNHSALPDRRCECADHLDEIGLPLSKRICRLHIQSESPHGQQQQLPVGGHLLQHNPVGHQQNPFANQQQIQMAQMATSHGAHFGDIYPYDVDSPYFAINELLHNLYLERNRRRQQLLEEMERNRPASTPSFHQ